MTLIIYDSEEYSLDNYNFDDSIYIDLKNIDLFEDEYNLSSFSDKFADIIHNEFKDTVYTISINDIYFHLLKKIYMLIEYINKILNSNVIEKIVLFGGNEKFRYLPFYFSESIEDGKKFLHKTHWFYNKILFDTFNQKVKISFIKKDNLFKLNIIKKVRQFSLFYITSFFIIVKHIKQIFNFSKKINLKRNINTIIPIRTIHQARFVFPLLREMKKDSFIVLFYEGLRAKNVYEFLAENKDIKIYSFYTCKNFIKTLYFIFKEFFILLKFNRMNKKNLTIKLNDISLILPKEEFFLETHTIPYFRLYENFLSDFFKEHLINAQTILSTEMMGKEAFIESSVAKKNNIELIQFQTAMFEPKPLPIFPIGDKFLANSLNNKKSLSTIGSIKNGKVDFLGLFRFSNILENNLLKFDKKIKKILYATQPHELESNKSILYNLNDYILKYNKSVKIIVKLHPRDNKKNYYDFTDNQNFEIISKIDVDLDSLILDVDVVISRFSTILQESLILGTPYIACLFSDLDKKIENDYLYDKLTVSTFDDLFKELSNLENLINKFKNCREKYFNDNQIKNANKLLAKYLEDKICVE